MPTPTLSTDMGDGLNGISLERDPATTVAVPSQPVNPGVMSPVAEPVPAPAPVVTPAPSLSTPTPLAPNNSYQTPHKRRWIKLLVIVLLTLLVVGGVAAAIWRTQQLRSSKGSFNSTTNGGSYSTVQIPLADFNKGAGQLLQSADQVVINGRLTVNDSLVLAPINQPNANVPGQIYYSAADNKVKYYDGSNYQTVLNSQDGATLNSLVNQALGTASQATTSTTGLTGNLNQALTDIATLKAQLANVPLDPTKIVTSLQGQSGALSLVAGDGIMINGTTISSSGVISLGGVSGNIAVGSGLSLSGNTLNNDGVVSLIAGTSNLSITTDGFGNYTINSLNSDGLSLPLHSVVVGQGSGQPLGSVSAASNGLCLVSTASGPAFMTCPGGNANAVGGSAGTIAKFSDNTTLTGSIISDNGSTATIQGGLKVTGFGAGVVQSASDGTLSTATIDRNGSLMTGTLSVANGGTGLSTPIGAGQLLGGTGAGYTAIDLLAGNGIHIDTTTGAITVSVLNSTCDVNGCQYVPSPGSGDYIQNGTAVQTAANFNISGGGTATILNATSSLRLNGNDINVAGTLSNVAYLSQSNTFSGSITISGANALTTGTGAVTFGSLGTGIVQSNSTGNLSSGAVSRNSSTLLTDALSAGNGGTGRTLLTANAVLFGNGNGAVGLAGGTPGQLLVADSSSVPTFTTITGDISVSASGVTTIQNGVVTNNKLQFDTFTVNPGNNLVGGGTATLGGTITLNVADSPTFAGPVNSDLGYQLNGSTIVSSTGQLSNLSADAGLITTGTIGIARGGTGLSTPLGANQLLGSNGSSYVATDLLAGAGISIAKVSGSMTFSVIGATCDANGCTYNPGTGSNSYIQNSTSLQASADFNISGGGTASTLNATTSLQLNGADINTAGTLTNVAYLNQANTFSGNLAVSGSNSLTVGGTVTFSGLGAGVVQSSSTGVLSSGALDRNSATLMTGVLSVPNGGTGLATVPVNAVLYGNGTSALASVSGTSGQVLLADNSGVPTFVSLSGDVTVSSTGVVTIANGAVTNSKLANSSVTINTSTGLTGGGALSLGGSLTLGIDSTVCTTTAANCSDTGTSGAYIQNSLSVQANAKFNIDGTGKANIFNAVTALEINGADINTAGTLNNVAYLNQANTFTGSLTVSGSTSNLAVGGTVTFSGLTAGIVQSDGTGLLSSSAVDRNSSSLLSGTLNVAYGGTGLSSLTANALLLGNGTSAVGLASGSAGQLLVADASGVPTFVTPTGDVTINAAGVTVIGNGTVTNTKLANDNVTINTNPGLTGGGTLALGGSLTLGIDSTVCTTSGNCDSGSSTNYIHNSTSLQASANFNIDGTGIAGILNALTSFKLNGVDINTAGTLSNVAYLNQANSFSGNLAVTGTNTLTVGGAVTFSNLSTGIVQSGAGGALSSGAVDRNSSSLLSGTLNVAYGGTGRSTLTANALLYGNGTSQVSLATGTSGQLLMISGTGVPTFVTPSGDVTIDATGVTTIGSGKVTNSKLANNSVTINTSAGLTGGATVALGGSLTLGIDSTVCTTSGNCADTGGTNFYIQNGLTLQTSANFNIDGTGKANVLNAVTALQLNGTNINTAGTLNNVAYLNQANVFTGNLAISGANLSTNGTVTFSGLSTGVVQSDAGGVLSSSTVDRNGALLTGTLNVAYGGTGRATLTANSLLYGNGTGSVGLAAGTAGQLLMISGTGVPTFVTPSGDVTIDATGVTTIGTGVVTNDKLANNSVTINTSTGLTGGGSIALGGSLTLGLDSTVCTTTAGNCSISGGSNFYIQNTTTLQTSANFNIDGVGAAGTFNAGTEYQLAGTPIITSTGVLQNVTASAGIITSGIFGIARGGTGVSSIGSAGSIAYSNGSNYTFTSVGTAGYCLASGGTGIPTWIDCSAAAGGGTPGGAAGGDLSGTYPDPSVAKIQGTALNITGPTTGQILVWNGTGWTNVSVSGAIAIDATGVATIQPNSVALGTDTTGNYVDSVAVGADLSLGGTSGEGAQPVISLSTNVARLNAAQSFSATQTFGSTGTSLAVTNNATLGGTLTLGGDVTVSRTAANILSLATGDSLNLISGNLEQAGTVVLTSTGVLQNVTADAGIINSGTFGIARGGTNTASLGAAGTVAYSNGTSYAFTAAGTSGYCLVSGGSGTPVWQDCSAAAGGVGIGSAAGGDLSGTYPNPSVAKIQGTALNIATPTGGQILVWDGTNGWTNTTLSGDVAINSVGAATIQPNSVALGTDTTGNYVVGLTNGTGIAISGTAGEAWSPTVSLTNTTVTAGGYGSAASVATFTVDAQGRLTIAGNQAINIDASQVGSGTLSVVRGGTGLGTLTANGILFGNGTSAAGVTAAGTAGQFLQAGTGGVPGFVTISGDATIANGGVLTIANGAVTNAKLVSSSITINVGTGMTGGGAVSLGGSLAIGLDSSVVCTTSAGNCANTSLSNIASTNLSAPLNVTSGNLTLQTTTSGNINISPVGTINLNSNVVVAAGSSLTITGGNTASRPASPTAGTLYYDTTTNTLLQYNGTKWVSAPRTTTKIVAASNSSQAMKDAADYVGDGTADQVEINAALTAAAGGRVYLAEGTYTINASISIPDNTTLAGAGAGTLITIPNGINTSFQAVKNTNTVSGTGIGIQDLVLDGNKANQTSGTMYGVAFSGVGSSTTTGATVSNVRANNWYGGYGFQISGTDNSTFTNNTANGDDSRGFSILSSSNNNTFTANDVNSGGTYGFEIGTSSSNNTFNANNVSGASEGFHITSANNSFTGNNISGNTYGIRLSGATGNNFTANILTGNTSYGFNLSASSNNNTISTNTLADNGGSTANSAIYLLSSSYNTITDNSITDTSATSTNYAIYIGSGSTNNYLSNNFFSSTPGTSTINEAGTGTTYANQSTSENGGGLVVRGANSTTAWRIQNASGTALLTADTSGNIINVAGNLQVSGTTVITSARVLQNVTADTGILTTGTLPVARGGTGATTFTAGGVLYGNTTSAIGVSAAGTSGYCLISGGAGAPTWASCGSQATSSGAANTALSNIASTNLSAPLNVTSGNLTLQTTTSGNINISPVGTINLNSNVIVAAGDYLQLTGSGTRPASPTAGMLYYDTTTNTLLQYNGSKWVSAPRTATKIVAASNSSQAMKDAADYVATGTGDQATINTALTAAAGGKVYLAEGTYTINGSISIPNNTTLAGAGAGTLITIPNSLNTSINAITNTTTGGSGTGVTVQDLLLDGNKANQTSGTMTGVYVNGMGSSTAKGATVTNVQANNWHYSGFNVVGSLNDTFTNNTANLNDSYGFNVSNTSSNNTLTGNVANNNATGFNVAGSSNTLTGNVANNNSDGFYVGGANNTLTGNTATNNVRGFNLNGGSNNSVITSNTLTGNTSNGMFIASSNLTISNNNIANSGGSTDNNALYLVSASYNIITNNYITDTSATSTNTAIYIYNSSSTANYLSGNIFTSTPGNSTIYNGGTGTIYSNQPISENGANIVNRTANSTTAFQIQNASGVSLFNVDTNSSNVNVNANLQIAGTTVITSGLALQNVSADTSILTSGTLSVARGGTNATSLGSAGSIAYSNGTGYAFSGVGTSGYCLVSGGTGAPTWVSCATAAGVGGSYINNGLTVQTSANFNIDGTGTAATLNATTALQTNGTTRITSTGVLQNVTIDAGLITTGTLAVGNGGTGNTAVGSAGSVPYSNGTIYSFSGVGTSGQCLLSGGTSTPTWGSCSGGGTYVNLQGSTPGTAQTGNINVSGTIIAGIFNGSGSGLSNLNATNITSGTLADARLSSNVALRNSANTFTADNLIKETSNTAFQIQNAGGTSLLTANTTTSTIGINGAPTYNTYRTAGGFATAANYTTGSSPQGIATADFNSDGKLDLVTANNGASSISVLMGNGDGTFVSKVDYSTGTNAPRAVATADFNGDGKTDIVAVCYDHITVFINNGNGTFAAGVTYTMGTGGYGVTTGDFNGDGKPDIAVALNNGGSTATVSVFINNGSGAFAAAVNYNTDINAVAIATADFNGDGKLDLAVVNNYYGTLSILNGNGDGTFAARVNYATGTNPFFLAIGDFSGDGKPDIAVTNYASNTVSVFINNGSGTFATKVDYTTGSHPYGVTAADFNGDGKTDLAAANYSSNTVSVFINNGSGTFAGKVDYATSTNPEGVTAADFDGNGQIDLAVANNGAASASVLLNGVGLITVTSALSVVAPSNTQTALLLQGVASQAVDYLRIMDSTTSNLVNVDSTGLLYAHKGLSVSGNTLLNGNLKLQPTTDSTTAFQIQNAAGTTLLNVDTSGSNVSLGVGNSFIGGFSSVFGNDNTGAQNGMIAQRFTAGSTSTLKSISVYFTSAQASPNNQFSVALYSDGGACGTLAHCPGSKIAESASTTITGNGWNAASITASLVSGTSYWMSVNNNGTTGNNTEYQAGTSSDYYAFKSQTFGTWPASFSTPGFTGTSEISMFATAYIPGTNALVTDSNGHVAIGGNTTDNSFQLLINSNTGNAIKVLGAADIFGEQSVTSSSMYAFSVNSGISSPFNVDAANGRIDINVNPTYTWADGALNVQQLSGTANILKLYNNGSVAQFVVTSSGNVLLGADSGKTISNDQSASGAGQSLTVAAGQGASGQIGGNLYLQAGANGTASGTPGSVVIKANGGDSTTAFQVQNAAGTTNLLTADTVNNKLTVTSLSVTASISLPHGTDYSTTGIQNNVNFGSASLYRLTGASAQTITGIAGGSDGRQITIMNAANQAATLSNNSGSSSVGNKIITGTGSDLTIAAGASVSLVYDSVATVWRVVGTISGTTSGGSYVTLQGGTPVADAGSFSVSGTGSLGGALTVTTNSATALLIQNTSSAAMLNVDTTTGIITLGNGGNTVVFNPASGLTASGTAQHTKSIVLNAEYAGAVLDALDDSSCSAAYNGTMTSGYDATNRMNFYNWTSAQTTNQCYDVVAQVTLPSDWASWAASDPLNIKMITSDATNSAVSFKVVTASGTADANYNYGTFTVTTSWADAAGSAFSGTYNAGDTIIIKIRMTSKNNANIKAGPITLNYNSKF